MTDDAREAPREQDLRGHCSIAKESTQTHYEKFKLMRIRQGCVE
jgi:hypothetical protein